MEEEYVKLFIGKNVKIEVERDYEGECGIIEEIKNDSIIMGKRYNIEVITRDVDNVQSYSQSKRGVALIDISIIHSIKERKRQPSKRTIIKNWKKSEKAKMQIARTQIIF